MTWHVVERLRRIGIFGAFVPAFFANKRVIIHMAFFALMGVVVWQSKASGGVDRTSLLYSFISGEQVVEGPLDPAAYAQTNMPGTGGPRVAAVDTSAVDFINVGGDIATDDAEFQFSNVLGGSAVVAQLAPVVAEPGSDNSSASGATHKAVKPFIYAVESGDTVSAIAAKFNISTNTVLWANGLTIRTPLKVGDYLTILPTTGVVHKVANGDTVMEIAQKYDAKSADIIAYNNLGDDAKLSVGQKIIVPDGNITPQAVPDANPNSNELANQDEPRPTPQPLVSTGSGWLWPTVSRHISQYFGQHGHTGIDIDNRSLPPVFAAKSGTVEFTGWLGGYGNLVILNHGNGVSTYYAHLTKFYVNKGQQVNKGDAIAKMGSTGRSTGPHLHFEVRLGGRQINPLGVL